MEHPIPRKSLISLLYILVKHGHNHDSAKSLAAKYASVRANYAGSPHLDGVDFDTELIDTVLSSMKRANV